MTETFPFQQQPIREVLEDGVQALRRLIAQLRRIGVHLEPSRMESEAAFQREQLVAETYITLEKLLPDFDRLLTVLTGRVSFSEASYGLSEPEMVERVADGMFELHGYLQDFLAAFPHSEGQPRTICHHTLWLVYEKHVCPALIALAVLDPGARMASSLPPDRAAYRRLEVLRNQLWNDATLLPIWLNAMRETALPDDPVRAEVIERRAALLEQCLTHHLPPFRAALELLVEEAGEQHAAAVAAS